MKKKFSIALMIMSLAFSAFALTACGHTHDYKETVLENGTNIATEATCTAKATYYKVCQCGEVHATETFEYGSMLPHDYQSIVATGETNLVTPATCSTYAVYKKVCSECGVEHATETFQGTEYDANAHVFEETIGTENKVSDATCISLAVYKKLCACGEMHATETFTAGTVDNTNHVGFDNEVIDNKYLVAEGGANHFHGTRYYKSCDCGEAHASDYFETDDVIPHTFNVDTVNPDALKEAADHTHGNIYYKSCECGAIGTEATFEDTSSVIPHTYGEIVLNENANLVAVATCVSPAVYKKACSCGVMHDSETFTFGALDDTNHVGFDNEVIDDKYLVAEGGANHFHGTRYYKSCDCGEAHASEYFEADDVIPHTFNVDTVNPDALKEGADHFHGNIYYKSCVCGAIGTEETFEDASSKIPHTFDQEVIDTDALKEAANHFHGNIYYLSCSCGEVSEDATQTFEDTASKIAHTFDQEVVDEEYATGVVADHTHGTEYFKSCTCGTASESDKFYDDDVVPHTFDQEVISTEALKEEANHFHGNIYYKSCECGAIGTEATFEDEASIIAHTFNQEVVDEKYATGVVADHTHGTEYYKSCTCGTASESDKFYDDDVVPHTFDQEVISTEALKEEANHFHGNIYYKSCGCGAIGTEATFEDTASKIAHTFNKAVKSSETLVGTEGNVTTYYLSCSCGTISDSETFTVTETTHEEINVSLQKNAENVTIPVVALGTIVSVTFDGNAITDYTFNAGVSLVVPKSVYQNTLKKATLVINTLNGNDEYQDTVVLDIATMIIEDKADLLTFATLTRDKSWGAGELYVVDADIDMEGAEYNFNLSTDGPNNTTGTGFAGTFDGRGNAIKNIVMGTNGFISGIRQDGVLKNVAFLNATQNGTGFIAEASLIGTKWTVQTAGRVENVYIQVNATVSNSSAFGAGNFGATRIVNVVVDVMNKVDSYAFWNMCYHGTYTAHNNVYGINVDKFKHGSNGTAINAITDKTQIFANVDAFKAGGKTVNDKHDIDYSAMDNDFWDIANGIPVPAKAKAIKPVINNTEEVVFAGSTVTIKTNAIPFVKYELTEAVAGVSINGNTFTVTSDAEGATFTVKVTNLATGESATKSFVVPQTISKTADEFNVSLSEITGDTVVIPYTEEGEIEKVTFDGSAISDYTHENGVSITIAKSVLASKLKLANLVITAQQGIDVVQTTIPLDIATMIIKDKADLLAFATLTRGKTWGAGELYVLDGDIDMEGATYSININVAGAQNTTGDGFAGTFDGRGYAIKNIVMGTNGFISGIRRDGYLKNVAFINATQVGENFLTGSGSRHHGGNVVDVYAQITATETAKSFFGRNYGGAKFNRVVVDVVSKVGDYWFQYDETNVCYSYQNIYGINVTDGNATKTFASGANGNTGNKADKLVAAAKTNVSKAEDGSLTIKSGISARAPANMSDILDKIAFFADYNAYKAGGTDYYGNTINYSVFDNDFWDIVNGAPIPAKLKNAVPEILNDASVVVPEIATYLKINAVPFVKTELVEAVEGVSVNGSVIMATEAAQGKTFTVKVTNLATEQSATKTFTVAEPEVIELASKDIDLGVAADTVAVDLSATLNAKGIADDDVTSVIYGGREVAYTLTNGVLTYAKSALNVETNLGEHTIVVSATNDSGDYTIKQPVVMCSKIIMNKEDATKMLSYALDTNDQTARKSKTGYFILGASFSMGGSRFGIGYYGQDANQGVTTNGTLNPMYRATFDGRGHTVSDVAQSNNAAGLFGYAANSTVKNVNFTNVNINGTHAIVIYQTGANSTNTIENVFVQGKVSTLTRSYSPTGFIAGKVDGTLILNNVFVVIDSHSIMPNAYYLEDSDDKNDNAGVEYCGAFAPQVYSTFSNKLTITNSVALNLQDETNLGKVALGPSSVTYPQAMLTTKEASYALTGYSGTAWEAFKAYCAPAQAE